MSKISHFSRKNMKNVKLCGDFRISHETYKKSVCGRSRILKCFQTRITRKIILLIRLCRLLGSLDSSPG